MTFRPFKLERYFSEYEFRAPYLLCCSDCEPLGLSEVLSLANPESLQLWEELQLGYTESQGYSLLREEISDLYISIRPQDVLVVTPEEGIFISMNVMLEKGDHVIVTCPGYQSLYEIARYIGCDVTEWVAEQKGEWCFDVDWLRSQTRKRTRLIVINFPHNPTGALISKSDFDDLLEIAESRGIYVFSDEMYRLLEYNEEDRLATASDEYWNAVSLSGLSKAFALAGLRLGWLTTRNEQLLQRLAAFKDYTTICGSAPSEILALIALRAKERIIARNLAIIRDNMVLADRFFQDRSDLFAWVRPRAGTVGFPELLSGDVSGFCSDLLCTRGVLLLPGQVYDGTWSHFRIGLGRKNMPQALERLADFTEEWVG